MADRVRELLYGGLSHRAQRAYVGLGHLRGEVRRVGRVLLIAACPPVR